jgi:hypothetical protein
MISGYSIRIATKKYQRRKHRKKRINKKWQKRYGFVEYHMMPDGKVMLIDGVLWMNEKTLMGLKENI